MLKTRLIATAAAALSAVVALAACGGSSSGGSLHCKGGTMKMADGQVMCKSAMKSGMTTTGGTTKIRISTSVPEVNGQKPVPMVVIADSYWQGMRIQAQTMTPIPFMVYNGKRARMVHPQKHASFHLMIVLSGAKTGKPIPYGSVWATIQNSGGRTIYNDAQWPMLSAFIGPHYGNDVPYLAPGRYTLTVLVTPPSGARTGAYANVWTRTHKVVDSFTWNGHKVTSGSKMTASSMGSMGMSGSGTEVNGYRQMAAKTFGTSYWQGMKILGQTASPRPYYYFTTGISNLQRTLVKPPSGANAYLIETLEDEHTFEPIPYATVTATVLDSTGKAVYTGQLVHTVSAFEQPFYANNVKLPGPGRYKVILRIGPPVAARHKEYWDVWLHPHTVVQYINWNGR